MNGESIVGHRIGRLHAEDGETVLMYVCSFDQAAVTHGPGYYASKPRLALRVCAQIPGQRESKAKHNPIVEYEEGKHFAQSALVRLRTWMADLLRYQSISSAEEFLEVLEEFLAN